MLVFVGLWEVVGFVVVYVYVDDVVGGGVYVFFYFVVGVIVVDGIGNGGQGMVGIVIDLVVQEVVDYGVVSNIYIVGWDVVVYGVYVDYFIVAVVDGCGVLGYGCCCLGWVGVLLWLVRGGLWSLLLYQWLLVLGGLVWLVGLFYGCDLLW